ncbi:MAG: bile acid:sodium symporter family protein [Undibacterium sp.]
MLQTGVHRRWDDLPFLGLAAALMLGLLFPEWFVSARGLTVFFLQFIFFISGLRIDFVSIASELRDTRLLFAVGMLRLVAFPLLVAGLAQAFFPELLAPLVLLSAMPAGMTSPLFVDMIQGNVPLSLFVTAGTSLLSVLSLPLILGFLGGTATTLGSGVIFQTLFLVMVLPLLAAQIVRISSFGQQVIHRSQKVARVGSVLVLWLLIATIASKHSDGILAGLMGAGSIKAFFLMSGLLLLFHVACYFVCFWRNRKDRLTVTLSLSYMNFTLAIFLAESLFRDSAAVMVVILSMLPWNIGLLLFQWWVRRSGWMLPEREQKENPLSRARLVRLISS